MYSSSYVVFNIVVFQNYTAVGEWNYCTYYHTEPRNRSLVSWRDKLLFLRVFWLTAMAETNILLLFFLKGSLAFESNGLCLGC